MRCRPCNPVPEEVRRAAGLLERRWTISILYASIDGAAALQRVPRRARPRAARDPGDAAERPRRGGPPRPARAGHAPAGGRVHAHRRRPAARARRARARPLVPPVAHGAAPGRAARVGSPRGRRGRFAELERVAAEQAALRRVATLVAEGAGEDELAAAVTSEIGRLFGAQRANMLRWDGDTIRVIGRLARAARAAARASPRWSIPSAATRSPRASSRAAAPARLDSRGRPPHRVRAEALGGARPAGGDRRADRGRRRDLGPRRRRSARSPTIRSRRGSSIGSHDFAALVAQAIINAEARREAAELVEEQSALRRDRDPRRGRTPAGRGARRGHLRGRAAVRRDPGARRAPRRTAADERRRRGGVERPERRASSSRGRRTTRRPGGATLAVLETGVASCFDESSPDRGPRSVICAPLIVNASIVGRADGVAPGRRRRSARGAETRLRSFADLAAQSIANERARAELRESRARIVRTADETRRRLERNLHDGAQQRLVSASLTLRLAIGAAVRRAAQGRPRAARRGDGRADAGARGAARPRPRPPPGDPVRPRPRARAQRPGRARAAPGRARRTRSTGDCPPRSRRPSTTSSPSR